ncbi:MAG TPA: gamma-glutamylcyclotransferase [Ensifer sp.]|nr:gamma-glutamylcyclotransferase [Ensifer sp.]
MEDFWVFGYGSLMWKPGFAFEERQIARAYGYRRSLCIRSWVHRGTRENPGLVLGLDRGGSCKGVAFRVADAEREAVIAYLRERELVTNVYLERFAQARLADGRWVRTLIYVADPRHEQFERPSNPEEAAEIVARSVGASGHNLDYVRNTVTHMRELGIRDHWLESVLHHADSLTSAITGP